MRRLVVLAPSIGHTTTQFDPLLERLRGEEAWGEETFLLRYEHRATVFSRRRADDLADDLASLIETAWTVDGPFDDVVLMGHSLGGILVRAAYLRGLGSSRNAQQPKAWAHVVHRIVLFAAFNRGVHLHRYERFAMAFLPWQSLMRDLMIGSDFVTNVRLWWIRKLTSRDENKLPVVVQVRGTLDDRVEREDSLDVEGFLQGQQLSLEATHSGLLKPGPGGTIDEEHYRVFRHAVFGQFRERDFGQRVADKGKKVFFVVHGIRAANDSWVDAVSTLIKQQEPEATVIPPTYGRFSALQFVVPLLRRSRVRWFQDLYSLELARNPEASFNFVGHSYGTYLAGHALRHLSGMQFDRVSLNGSVLPADWLWDSYRGQVKELRNARANMDIPVGVLCSALRGLRMLDVGTAGYDGFHIPFANNTEFCYYKGGHSATVSGDGREHIVRFMLEGSTVKPGSMVEKIEWFSTLSAGAWVLPYVLLAGSAGVAALAGWKFGGGNPVRQVKWSAGALLAAGSVVGAVLRFF